MRRQLASLIVTCVGCGDNISVGGPDAPPTDPTFCDLNPGVFEDPNACVSDESCPSPADVDLDMQAVHTFHTSSDDNPEIIKIVPNSINRAVWISTVAKKFSLVEYDDENGFAVTGQFDVPFDVGLTPGAGEAAFTSAIDVHPSGKFIAVAVTKTSPTACLPGVVSFVNIDDDVGAQLKQVTVGFYPDSVDFSPDGNWLVVANEDDSADPCKVGAGRVGGSVSVIQLPGGDATAASQVQEIEVRHAANPPSEPENIRVGSDSNTVVFAIQESSEVGIFKLNDVPAAVPTIVALPASEFEPDGIAISEDVSFAVVVAEKTDSFSTLDLATNTWLQTYNIVTHGDVPAGWAKDTRKPTKIHEPQEIELFRQKGAPFALISLQESHGIIAYDLSNPATPVFDSIAPAGDDWEGEANSVIGSLIGPEGIAVNPRTGVLFSANEREGTVTMFRTAFAHKCP